MNYQLDSEGYPTEDFLNFLKGYKGERPIGEVVQIILNNWYYDWYQLEDVEDGKRTLQLHTGGWSGNEDIISSILSNHWLTHGKMKYVQWNRGGHYRFEIKWEDENS